MGLLRLEDWDRLRARGAGEKGKNRRYVDRVFASWFDGIGSGQTLWM